MITDHFNLNGKTFRLIWPNKFKKIKIVKTFPQGINDRNQTIEDML